MGGVLMPQLSLYIDEDILKKIEIAAKLEHISISKYVVLKINDNLTNSWPENYEKLFGSIKDETFQFDTIETFESDLPREKI